MMTSQAGLEIRLEGAFASFSLSVDLEVPVHGVTALFGGSGSGKTTLLRAISGFEPRMRGTVSVLGDIWQDEKIFLAPHRRSVGYVFQESSLFDHLDVRKNLEFGWNRTARECRKVRFEEVVDQLALEPLLNRCPQRLSGGERQRVAIGRALLSSPRVLLLDEPLASLDVSSRREIIPYLKSLHDRLQIPILYVSHSFIEVEILADYLVVLDLGRVKHQGRMPEIASELARDELLLLSN